MRKLTIIWLGVVCVLLLFLGRQFFFKEKRPTGEPPAHLDHSKEASTTPSGQYNDIVPVLKEHSENLVEEAIKHVYREEFNRAIDAFRAAIKVAPFDPRPYFHLANLYLHTGNDDMALKILEQASKFGASFGVVVKNLNFDFIESHRKAPVDEAQKIFIAPFRDHKRAAVTIFFDDGPKSAYTQALPLLDRFGYKATISINPGVIGEHHTHRAWGTWGDWRDASRRGYEIANHGYDHIGLTDQDEASLERQVNMSHAVIARKIGVLPLSFVFPQDLSNDASLKKALERHIALRDHDYLRRVYEHIFIPVYGHKSFKAETANQLIDLAIKKRLWLIAQCHGIETDDLKTYKPITLEFLNDHLTYMKDREDHLWVDTFINIYRYLNERKKAKLELVDETESGLTFKLSTSLNLKIYNYPLTVVINTRGSQPSKVMAFQEGADKPLQVAIHNDQVYVTVLPSGKPVHVSWE